MYRWCAHSVKIAGLSSWWLVGILHRTAIAQPPPGPDPALTGRLEALAQNLDKRREELHIPGMAIAVVMDDKVVLSRGFGLRDIEKHAAVDEKTLFAIGSSSKAFTSALCAMMVDEGKMAWDDAVSKHFAPFTLSADAAKGATIRDVLSHRTGVARTDMLWYAGSASIEQVYAALGKAKPKDEFRKAFNYNNNTYSAAGFAAAHAAGTDWDTTIKARIFTPLGMSSTNTSVKATRENADAATGYTWDDDAKQFRAKPMRDLTLAAPAGAINSNVVDMARWVRLQLGRGTFEGKTLISKGALEETWTRQIAIGAGVGYGMGWMLQEWNGKRVVEHGGNIDGFAAEVGMLPDDHAGFVLLTNVSATPLQSESLHMVWETLFPPATPAGEGALSADKLQEFVGEYRFAMQGSDVKVLVKDGKLWVDVPGQTVYELKWPDKSGRWYFALTNTIAAGFVRNDKGQITSMTFYQGGLEMDLPRKGAEVPPAPYTEAGLAQFTGEYHFEYLGRSEDWRVHVREGRLACDVPKQFSFTLRWPDEKGTWAFQELKALTLEFEKAPDGAVVAINAHQGGMDFHLPRKGGPSAAGAALPTLDALMAKRKAAGAGLAAAGVVRLTGKVEIPMQGVDGTVSTVMSGTDRFKNLLDFPPFGHIYTSSDGARVFVDSIGDDLHEVHGAKRDEAIRQGPGTFWADLRTMYDTVEVAGEETVGDVRAVVVRASKKDGKSRTRCLIDPANGLPLREETTTTIEGIGAIPVKFTYSDFRTQAGITMPFRVSISNDLSGGLDIVYDAFETGLKEAPGMFVLAPSPAK